MRVTIFDDDGNELAEGSVTGLKLDSRTQHVDVSAEVTQTWRAYPECGRSAQSCIAALMDHIIASGQTDISYSRPASIQSVGL